MQKKNVAISRHSAGGNFMSGFAGKSVLNILHKCRCHVNVNINPFQEKNCNSSNCSKDDSENGKIHRILSLDIDYINGKW